jgi:hypothetical protein
MDQQTRRAWGGLVRYANGEVAEIAELRGILADCMTWITAIDPFGLFGLNDTNLSQQASDYRPAIDALLRWLCSGPESKERACFHAQALEFLGEHCKHIRLELKEVSYVLQELNKLNYSPGELEGFREQQHRIFEGSRYRAANGAMAGTNFSPFGILAPAKEYEDFADPICDFLLSQYQSRLNKEYSNDRMDKASAPLVPIFVCPSCDKIVMPERTGRKKFCSACSSKARTQKYLQKASPNENRDYQWLYRLLHAKPDVRKMYMRNEKNRTRLREIKTRQRQSSRCKNLMQNMGL